VNSRGDTPGFGRAVAIGLSAAPLAIAGGGVIRSLLSPPAAPSGINAVAGASFGVALLLLYGTPLASGCGVFILWPIAAVLRDTRRYRWWMIASVGGAIGHVADHQDDSDPNQPVLSGAAS
jgi:hypothetical protein